MKQTGYVTEIEQDTITVRIDRESACGGNCVSCKGCPNDALLIKCHTSLDLTIGEKVLLTTPNNRFFKNVFLGYGFTTLITILGAVMGYIISKDDNGSVLGCILGLIVGILILKIFFKKDNEITVEKFRG